MTIKEIEKILDDDKKRNHPTVPYLVKTKLKGSTANSLTDSIIKIIKLKKGWATRINNMGVYDASRKIYRTSNTEKGTADIHGCLNGRHLSIEIKIGKDKQSEEQKKMQEKITLAGGWYCIAKTLDQFLTDFENEFE